MDYRTKGKAAYNRLPNVGVDIDGVLYDFTRSVRVYLAQRDGANNYNMPSVPRWDFYQPWGLTDDDFIELCHQGVDAGVIFYHGAPMAHARRMMWDLSFISKVHLITDRFFGTKSRENTLKWLAQWKIPYDSLTFSYHKVIAADHNSVTMFIDDRPKNVIELRDAGIEAYLLDRPWNQEDRTLPRVMNLDEFTQKVEGRVYAKR